VSETSPESPAETDIVGGQDQLPQPSPLAAEVPPPPVEPAIPGDRLGIPLGATRVIADYGRPRPSYVFLGLVSVLTLAADLGSKAWAEQHLDGNTVAELWKNHVTLLLAKNRGGAWGLLQSTSENVRRPFFLLVSVAAIAFIMTLYRRLNPNQRALKWGLPLVLGGALGNVFDRIRYGHVIDFIDYRADWMRVMNEKLLHNSNDHWPTFNIADVAICVGVGLMALDMFTSKQRPGQRRWGWARPAEVPTADLRRVPPSQSGEPAADWYGGPPVPPPVVEPPVVEPPVVEPPVVAAVPADAPPVEAPPTK
jgi:signal peptidase II